MMPVPHSPPPWSHFVLMVGVWTATPLFPIQARAQDVVVLPRGCELGASAAECAPDQHLARDAARPARRFASYSDVAALVRGRVSLGLALAPFTDGSLRRLRLEIEVVTWLKNQRGVELTARVGAMVHGRGLSGLFLGVAASYVARVQPGGQLQLGAELGYSRQFASLYVSAAAGVRVEAWARAAQYDVSPTVRLLLGHAFY